jgi:hypothetical protein
MAVAIAKHRGLRALLRTAWVPLLAGGAFFWTFAHVTNFNHGATPGMSRYALWLIPLAIPLLRAAREPASATNDTHPLGRRQLAALALASVAWSLAFFNPYRSEGVGTPSALARLAWHHFPALDNPLPEIFVERNSGFETTAMPVAEPGCAKVLLMAGAEGDGTWPIPCPPARVPPVCSRPGALCYANRTGTHYEFVTVPPRLYQVFTLRNDTWPPGAERFVSGLLAGEEWRGARQVRAGHAGTMLRAAHLVRGTHVLQAPDRLFVCAISSRDGAVLDVRIPSPMRGVVLDLVTGTPLREVELYGRHALERVELPTMDLVGFLAVAR